MIYVILIWITLCIVNTILGSKREIGWLAAILISFFFSPLVGFLFVAFSKDKIEQAYKMKLLQSQERIIKLLEKKDIDENEL